MAKGSFSTRWVLGLVNEAIKNIQNKRREDVAKEHNNSFRVRLGLVPKIEAKNVDFQYIDVEKLEAFGKYNASANYCMDQYDLRNIKELCLKLTSHGGEHPEITISDSEIMLMGRWQ